jgi:DNA-binding IclR family transcriptional regulator
MKELPDASGAQTVDRACELLKEIGRHGRVGARLVDLTDAMQLSRPTVHRILRSLVVASMVCRDAASKRYRLGPAIYELGLAAVGPVERIDELLPAIEELAKVTGDMVVVMLRRNDYALCIAQAAGDFPIRADVVRVGDIRPLAASIAGIPILASLSDDMIEKILDRTVPLLGKFSTFTRERVLAQIAQVRTIGISSGDSVIVPGITGIGTAVPNHYGAPYIGISLAAISARMNSERMDMLVDRLRNTAEVLSHILARSQSSSERSR